MDYYFLVNNYKDIYQCNAHSFELDFVCVFDAM